MRALLSDKTYMRFYYDEEAYENGDLQTGTYKFLRNSSGRQIEFYNDDGSELRDAAYYRFKNNTLSVAFDPDAEKVDMVKGQDYEAVCDKTADCGLQGSMPEPACAGGSWTCEYVCVQVCQQGREEWIKAVQDVFFDRGDNFDIVSPSALPDAARAVFEAYDRVWGDSFPPEAQKFEVDSQVVFLVLESHDGGFFGSFFDTDGYMITSGSAGESTDWQWND
jgi:hypothetical protein